MRLVPLTPDYPLTAFDCGDEDLNKFLLTVDAYLSAVPFYEKGGIRDVDNIVGGYHGFLHLTKKDEDEHTRLMYFDMMEIAE